MLLCLLAQCLLLTCRAGYIQGGLRRKGSENYIIPPTQFNQVQVETDSGEEPWWFISETGGGQAGRRARRLAQQQQRQEPDLQERPWWYRSDSEESNITERYVRKEPPAPAAQEPRALPDRPSYVAPMNWDHHGHYIPSCLQFREGLGHGLSPDDVVIFTGGDDLSRRLNGFGRLSADSVSAFARHHGYRLIFLDQLYYDRSLWYRGQRYCNYWHRVFALPALRAAAPRAKYVVWLDDDILVPHPETDMLNHYINRMHSDSEWQMTYAEEGGAYELNSGMFIMKNRDFAHDVYQRAMDVGMEMGWLHRFGYEQDSIKELRKREGLQRQIRIISHRQGKYNINNFAREAFHDPPGTRAEFGDAFVHFTGMGYDQRLHAMNRWLDRVRDWRSSLPAEVSVPVDTE